MNPIQTIREALEILRGAVGHADTIATADRGLTALAELEKQERDGPNWNPLPGWQQLADGTSCYTTTASTDQVAGEPVAWQRRMRPTWGSHSACPWSPWEPCTKGQAEDHWKTPLLHDWAYEARALCLAAPVAQQPQAEPDWVNGVPHWSPALIAKVKQMTAELDEPKQPQAEAVPPGFKHVCYLWVNRETLEYEVDHATHPLDELIPAYIAAAPKGQQPWVT